MTTQFSWGDLFRWLRKPVGSKMVIEQPEKTKGAAAPSRRDVEEAGTPKRFTMTTQFSWGDLFRWLRKPVGSKMVIEQPEKKIVPAKTSAKTEADTARARVEGILKSGDLAREVQRSTDLVADSLESALARHASARRVFRSLCLVEKAIADHGLVVLDRLSPKVAAQAILDVNNATRNEPDVPLACLCAAMQVRVVATSDKPPPPGGGAYETLMAHLAPHLEAEDHSAAAPSEFGFRPTITGNLDVGETSMSEFHEMSAEWHQKLVEKRSAN